MTDSPAKSPGMPPLASSGSHNTSLQGTPGASLTALPSAAPAPAPASASASHTPPATHLPPSSTAALASRSGSGQPIMASQALSRSGSHPTEIGSVLGNSMEGHPFPGGLQKTQFRSADGSEEDDSDDDDVAYVSLSGNPVKRRTKDMGKPLTEAKALAPDAAPPVHFLEGKEGIASLAQAKTIQEVFQIQPYVPTNDRNARRMRSFQALNRARAEIADKTGVPPRLVYDEESGYLIPRDQIAPQALPKDPYEQMKRNEADDEENATYHYKNSADIVNALREQRMMRALGGL